MRTREVSCMFSTPWNDVDPAEPTDVSARSGHHGSRCSGKVDGGQTALKRSASARAGGLTPRLTTILESAMPTNVSTMLHPPSSARRVSDPSGLPDHRHDLARNRGWRHSCQGSSTPPGGIRKSPAFLRHVAKTATLGQLLIFRRRGVGPDLPQRRTPPQARARAACGCARRSTRGLRRTTPPRPTRLPGNPGWSGRA